MSISTISSYSGLSISSSSTTSTRQNLQGTSSSDASSASSSLGVSSAAQPTSSDAVDEFKKILREPPQQRTFDLWLMRHHITKDEYSAMTPAEKQKLAQQFKEEIERDMKQKLQSSRTTSTSISILV